MIYFKFGRRFFKTSGLFDDGHHNGLAPLRNIPPRTILGPPQNTYEPNLDGQNIYMPYVSVQPEPSQFIRIMNRLIESDEREF